MILPSLLDNLVPVVDCERAHDPLSHFESAYAVLAQEGWTAEQMGEWAACCLALSGCSLQLLLDSRRN